MSGCELGLYPTGGAGSHCILLGRVMTCTRLYRRETNNRDTVNLMESLGRDGSRENRRGKEPELVLVASENKRLRERQKNSTLISAV